MRVTFLFYFLLALATRWLALPYLDSRFLGGSSLDAGLYVYLSKTALPALFTESWFNLKSFYPYGYALAWTDNFIFPSAVFHFFNFVLNAELAYNLILILAQCLNGYCSFILARQFKLPNTYAHLFGIFVCCYAYFTVQLGHPQIQFFFFIPLALFIFSNYLERPKKYKALLLGLTIGACFLTTVYYAIFIVLLLKLFSWCLLLQNFSFERFKNLFNLGFFAGLALIPLVPFVWPYLHVKEAFGARFLHEPAAFAIKPWALLNPSNLSFLYGNFALADGESQFFPGLVIACMIVFAILCYCQRTVTNLLLAFGTFLLLMAECWSHLFLDEYRILIRWFLIGIATWSLLNITPKSSRSALQNHPLIDAHFRCYPLVITLLLVLSFGPVAVNDNSLDPFVLLFNYFPGVEALRAVSRYSLLAIFLLVLLSLKLLAGKITLSWKLASTIGIFIFAENLCQQMAIEKLPATPKVVQELKLLAAEQKSTPVVMMLPQAIALKKDGTVASWQEFSRLNVNYLNWSTDANYFLVNGYSGQRSKIIKEFPSKLREFPDARSLQALSHIAGLKYVVFDSTKIPNFDRLNFIQQLEVFSTELRLLSEDSGIMLFELTRKPGLKGDFYLLASADPNVKLRLNINSKCGDSLQSASYKPELSIIDETFEQSQKIPLKSGRHHYDVNLPPVKNRLYTRKLLIQLPPECSGFLHETLVFK